MKCPKCSFISFDYNDACPKCGKDLTHERDLMDLPSYKPRALSLLAPLNAYSEIPGDTTRNGQLPLAKEAMDDVPEELLISLDDLSNDEALPIQIESDPTQAEPGQKTGELLISLDDLSDDEPVPIQIESDPTQAEPEQKVDDEIIFDMNLTNSEEAESKKDDLWDPEALEERMADIKFDDASEKTPDLFAGEEALGEAKEQEPIVELELEPLEFDLELEEPDKKTP